MAACFCCFRCCWNGTGFSTGHVPLKELPTVKLDTSHMGVHPDLIIHIANNRSIKALLFASKEISNPLNVQTCEAFQEYLVDTCIYTRTQEGHDVVIVKSGKRICGTGAALGNAPVAQNKAYFEVKVQSTGIWGVGLATRSVNLNSVPLGTDVQSWVVRQDGSLSHNNESHGKLSNLPQEGDVLGVTYDHVEMNFFLNGEPLNCPFPGVKGTVYPVFYVDEGAIIDVQFSTFYHQAPEGFDPIMIEQSLL